MQGLDTFAAFAAMIVNSLDAAETDYDAIKICIYDEAHPRHLRCRGHVQGRKTRAR